VVQNNSDRKKYSSCINEINSLIFNTFFKAKRVKKYLYWTVLDRSIEVSTKDNYFINGYYTFTRNKGIAIDHYRKRIKEDENNNCELFCIETNLLWTSPWGHITEDEIIFPMINVEVVTTKLNDINYLYGIYKYPLVTPPTSPKFPPGSNRKLSPN